MKKIPIIISLMILFSCGKTNSEPKLDKDKVISEVKQMFNIYHGDIAKDGLTAEFKYLDSTSEFYWVPPGYSSALKYDSIKSILIKNSRALHLAEFSWDTLEIFPLDQNLASYTGIVNGRTIDTAGTEAVFRIIESGTVIKRDGWKLLNGQSAILQATSEE